MPVFPLRKSAFEGGQLGGRILAPGRDLIGILCHFKMKHVEESQPKESMALNPSQKAGEGTEGKEQSI